MLVLSRKTGEAIIIAGTIRVVVAEINKARVRLAVNARPDVAIDREEIHLAKHLSPELSEVFTQQEYDVLPDQQDCVPAMFHGRQMYLRGGTELPVA